MLFLTITRQALLFGVAGLIIGLIGGSVGSMLYSAQLVDQALLEIDSLTSELSERDSRIDRLEESLTAQRHRPVRSIEVHLASKDQHMKLQISQHVRSLFDNLIGQDLDRVDPLLVAQVLNERLVVVDNQPYTLHLDLLVLHDTVELYVRAVKTSLD